MERGISVKKRTALGLAVSMATSYPVTLNALGLGELQSSSQLNQPLNAQIELLSTNAKEIGQLRVKLASADVFNRVGIDRPAYLNSLKFRTATQNGKPVILVSSAQPVQEPFLNFLLEVSWPQGQLLKEYTVLLDPPVLMQAGDAAPQNTASVRAEPKSSGVVNRVDAKQSQNQQAPADATKQLQAQAKTAQERMLEAEAKIAEQEEKQRAGRFDAVKPAASTTAASGGKKYRVRRGDTMQKVTSRLRYPGVTSSQMMIALFKANPHAFAKNNINYLKTGEVLTRPSRADVSSSSKSAARAQIKQHYAAWKQYRKGLASKTVVQKPVVSSDSKSSQDKAGTESETSTAKLSVVGSKAEATSSDNVSGSGNPDLQKKLVLAEEALASTSSKNVELESRVSKLEAIVRKKDRLIMLKNERLSRLESQLANAGVANVDNNKPLPDKPITGEPVAVDQASQVRVNEAEDLATSVGNEAEQKDNLIIRDDEVNKSEIAGVVDHSINSANANNTEKAAATIEHEKVADKPANDPLATSPFVADNKVEEGGLLDLLKSPLVAMIGGGSLLTLILGGLFLRRRQAAEADNEFINNEHDDFDLTDESFDTGFDSKHDEYATHESTNSTQSDRKPENTADVRDVDVRDAGEDELDKVLSADASLDDDEVLQEADVYIVYGLHEQAEEELKKAIAEKPTKLEYRYKLLENYQMADDSKAFVASAKDFLKAEGDNKQELWEKVVELGKKVAPENDMFAEKSSTKAATVFAGVAAAVATAGLATSDVFTDTHKTDDNLSVDVGSTVSSEEFESLLNTDTDLGFDDLDLSDMDAKSSHDLERPDEANISLGDTTIDDELKDDLDLSEFSDLGADDKFDFEGLDNLEGLGGLDELGALDDFETDNSNVLNFKDIESTIANDSASLNLELDSSTGLDKVLPTGSYSSELSSLSDDDDDNDALSFLNLPDDDQEMQDAHIGTKLDLARAYLDMGDVEGARCTLEEVVVEGNAAQKREAEEMLQQTG